MRTVRIMSRGRIVALIFGVESVKRDYTFGGYHFIDRFGVTIGGTLEDCDWILREL